MGVTNKATPVAKIATRRVRISATEAAYAKSQGISLEELAKSKLPKRGRPVGSKNKPKTEDRSLVDKLQEALAIEMRTNEAMQKLFEDMKSKVTLDKDVSLWNRIKFLVTGRL